MGDSRAEVVMERDIDPESLCRRVEDIPLGRSSPCCPKRGNLHKQIAFDLFTALDGEYLKDVNIRGDVTVCARCDSTIEEAMESSEEDNDNEDEDSVDGTARCYKVIIKCQCHDDLPFIVKNKGTYVLRPTFIMRRFVDHRRYGNDRPNRERRIKPIFASCVRSSHATEDITDHHQATIDLTISDKNGSVGEAKVHIGAKLTSLWDENGHIRHFIDDVVTGSPCDNMELRIEDEVLLLNDVVLVDVRATDLEEIFAKVQTDEEFSMLTRRITNRRSKLDFDRPEDITYEYWQIQATITVEDEKPILAERASVTQAHPGNRGIIVTADAHTLPVYIHTDGGFVKNEDGLLECHRNLNSKDTSFQFDMLSYDAYDFRGAKPVKQKIRLLRHYKGSCTHSYVYVGRRGDVTLQDAPSTFDVPKKNDINNDRSVQGFEIRRSAFLSKLASKSGEVYYLETFVENDLYLHFSRKVNILALKRITEDYMLPYEDNIKMEIIPR